MDRVNAVLDLLEQIATNVQQATITIHYVYHVMQLQIVHHTDNAAQQMDHVNATQDSQELTATNVHLDTTTILPVFHAMPM